MKNIENLFIERLNYSNDLSDCYKARYKVYCLEKKWIDYKNHPDKLENDKYDKYSKHIAIYNDNWNIQGYARFILNTDNLSLPIACHPGIKDKNIISRKSGESSRFIVLNNDYRTAISFLLLRTLFQTANYLEIKNSYIVVDPPFGRYLKKIGYICKILSEPKLYFGNYTIPVLVDVEATAENLKNMNNDYGSWFLDDNPFVPKSNFIFDYLYAPKTPKTTNNTKLKTAV